MSAPPELSPVELYRLLANMIRLGRVEDVRAGSSSSPARCTVRLSDELITDYLPWFALAAGGDSQTRHWRTPARGELCLLLAPEGDLAQAVALPGIYSTDMPQGSNSEDVERHDFSSTDFWEHHRPNGTLRLEIASAIELKVGSSVLRLTPDSTTLQTPQYTVDSPKSDFSGNVSIAGGISVAGGGSGGTSTITGNFNIRGSQFTHNGKDIGSTHTHTHPGDSGGSTGAPN